HDVERHGLQRLDAGLIRLADVFNRDDGLQEATRNLLSRRRRHRGANRIGLGAFDIPQSDCGNAPQRPTYSRTMHPARILQPSRPRPRRIPPIHWRLLSVSSVHTAGDHVVRQILTALAALTLLFAGPAAANPSEVARALPGAEKVGEAAYSVLSIRLFNAELYANGGAFSWERPFALTLTYDRAARAETLINRSIREMRSRGAGGAERLAPLRTQLERCFTSVSQGDRFTGVSTSQETA